ncbi:MAG TPA: PP2C family protein-serine/threonine phosphatase, partial [Thermoanaerobaculia bacterium]|nr:PP2C family protein-serine/threonine phosphatase [Thermoanaerobaculia bacterium]
MRARQLLLWIALAVAAGVAIVWLLPRAFPLLPRGYATDAREARAIALARIPELGPVPPRPLISVAWTGDNEIERAALQTGDAARRAIAGTPLEEALYGWIVRVFPPGANAGEWEYEVRVSRRGEVTSLQRKLPENAPAGKLTADQAHERARAQLAEAGFDLSQYGDPELRTDERAKRTDTVLHFPARRQLLGPTLRHGLEVRFLGDQPGGYQVWTEEVDRQAGEQLVGPYFLLFFATQIAGFLLLLGLGVLFARKYHAGEVGVRRGVQIFLLVLVAGIAYLLCYAVPSVEGVMIGPTSRRLTTWIVVLIRTVFGVLPIAALGFLAWTVGESWARERWGAKLAAFDALFKGDWRNATVARSSLRGVALGLALLALLLGVSVPLQRLGAWPLGSLLVQLGFGSAGWLGIGQLLRLICYQLPMLLIACLFFSTLASRKMPPALAAVASAVGAALVALPPFMPLPITAGAPVWLLAVAVPVLVFWACDLLSALLCGLVSAAVANCLPLLLAQDAGMQLQGWLPLVALALPLLLSLRHLHGGREFVYRWEDVPPHVRRIAERERQRVELETAREIQSSILPVLPPQLNGVELAHAYQPATEVGGDFYDVLALDDGRVALAVGDVAGHGVSSGLVMSMVRSALAVQVTFDPQVESVFHTLNRMVFQSARKRLLTTLTYALLDPVRRELVYASAGHVFPYRITRDGRVYELEAGSYPLGVRVDAMLPVRSERLEAGDTVVLLSDGVVEAHRENNEEPFGFGRLSESLSRHAPAG